MKLKIGQWQQTSERLLTSSAFASIDPNLFVGFSTRYGGVSQTPYQSLNLGLHVDDSEADVVENRTRIANDSGFPLHAWVGSEQVHGANVLEVHSSDQGKGAMTLNSAIPGTDGLYTRERGILLTSLYADCVPLYFVADSHSLIGVCHAGWQGTVKQIGRTMLLEWQSKYGIKPADVHVLIGPSISPEHYEVNQPVIDQVESVLPLMNESLLTQTKPGHYLLDLRKLNKMLLLNEGILNEHIHMTKACTFVDDAFFSHRQAQGKTGRMMSMIGFKKDE
ncbi:LOW QUALITY PROTEIN: hypothetical protein JCM19046_907 [Bacillus sp. JCM 19046]|nr:LOW QUALITY PROTEIN: hypothetical protein JCM19046_907 [Bacillus sp. JCM 19046]